MSERRKTKRHIFSKIIFTVVSASVVALCIITVIFTLMMNFVAVKESNGMEPSLRDHDVIIVNKLDTTPDFGDIIFIRQENGDELLARRVIAKGRQTVSVDYEKNAIIVDGQKIEDVYETEKMLLSGDCKYPFTVPENEYFVMGDNRNACTDSRFCEFGTVPQDRIAGTALLKIYPYGDVKILDNSLQEWNFREMIDALN